MMIHAVSAEIPTATGGLELIVDTNNVVRDKKSVTSRDMRPGMILLDKFLINLVPPWNVQKSPEG